MVKASTETKNNCNSDEVEQSFLLNIGVSCEDTP